MTRRRGDDRQPDSMFGYVSAEQRVPPDHPLRAIRALVDDILRDLSREFDRLYAAVGRPSVPPERLLRAQLLQIFCSIRSERLLMEQLDYNLLFRWFVGLGGSKTSDFVVGLLAGRRGATVYLLDRIKRKMDFVETCRAIGQLTERYPDTSTVLIEDAANGPAVISALQEQVRGVLPVKPEGGKVARAQAVQPQIEAGQVLLPRPRDADGREVAGRGWVEDFVTTCALFPNGAHDDDVDALTQLLVRCQQIGAPLRLGSWMCGGSQESLRGLGWEASVPDMIRGAYGRDWYR